MGNLVNMEERWRDGDDCDQSWWQKGDDEVWPVWDKCGKRQVGGKFKSNQMNQVTKMFAAEFTFNNSH